MNNLSDWEVIRRSFRKDRWYVQLKWLDRTQSMPQCRYNWLMANPSFNEIPEGYSIHHLDYDKLNDDPSNLALMQKYLHMAHHLKHKNIKVPVSIDEPNGSPIQKPKVYYWRARDRYYIQAKFRRKDGTKHYKRFCNAGKYGESFKSREQAEEGIKTLWPMMTY